MFQMCLPTDTTLPKDIAGGTPPGCGLSARLRSADIRNGPKDRPHFYHHFAARSSTRVCDLCPQNPYIGKDISASSSGWVTR